MLRPLLDQIAAELSGQTCMDHVQDPVMLHRVSVMTAAYAYFLANAGLSEVRWLAGEMTALFPAQLHEALQGAADPEAMAGFRLDRKLADLASLERLVDPADAAQWAGVLELCSRQVKVAAEMELQRLTLSGLAEPISVEYPGHVEGWQAGAVTLELVKGVQTK